MAASLKTIDPALKEYLKVHRITQIYEVTFSSFLLFWPELQAQVLLQLLALQF